MEDSALVAVDYRIVKGSTSLGGPILGVVGLPGEQGVWKSFDKSLVVVCPLDIFVEKTDGDDDGPCGPNDLREKVACRTMVRGWWGDGRECPEGGRTGMVG